ncbi:hypothetical protein EDF52_10279 [Curtobacterium sp. PhB42]|uniref:hypothetical protein n=1 Tax=unclassified Curtobacterium TaxID=257496 RepID=UPI001063AB00|nr:MULTISPECIES: hypothetical protein [unclassified Curtobacterium]TDW50991.1 hypothetical protein EDF52_10279 [Curtobacterium sp. PhB42]TDW56163.1 hypothetical protein EDF47_104274 [Curtobacterium sp. PhB190]
MTTAESLTEPPLPPALAAEVFYPEHWNITRDSGIPPLHQSELSEDQTLREEFLEGTRLLGVTGGRKEVKPQQLRLADVCNAGHSTIGVLLPRRSTKTTTLLALALGRCVSREDYLVGYTTCTTGQKARDRFRKDIVPVLERLFPDPASRAFKIRKAGGSERIEFDNGSIFQVLPPQGESFRSDAFDLIIFDEAGEASPEMTEDLLAGALPTFDTRPDAQLLVAGTAAKFREGNLLWDTLADGRAGNNSTGILEYAAADTTDMADLDDWDKVEALVAAAHPGVGVLTTMDVVKQRWGKLSRRQFAEEYLSIFGTAGAVQSFLNVEEWMAHGDSGALPPMPTDRTVGLAVTVHPDQSCAAITAAWRDDQGRACLLVVDYRSGSKWLAKRAKELAGKMRTPVIHDSTGTVVVEVEVMQRMKPRPRMAPQTWLDVSTSAALLAKEIDDGNVLHWNQDELTTAIQLVTKRGTPTSNRWAFGRREPGHSIITAEGASMALRYADANPKRARVRPKIAS